MSQKTIDISCDMGEGFGPWQLGSTNDEHLMKHITSANIATGFHAGDPNLMDLSIRRALANNVAIGAHPGFRDLQGFGRRKIEASAEEMVNDIIYQIGALREFVRLHGATLQHVKPHGALYMALAANKTASTHFVKTMRTVAPDTFIYCMGASETYRVASELGHPVVREFYADREYDTTGKIVFTRKPDDYNPQKAAERVLRACLEGKVRPVDGGDIDVGFESVCVHSDTPGSVELLIAIREALSSNGIAISAPSAGAAQQAA
ncbi:lactam utilization protein LamB [Agrobacterium tumefaciens]|uniref:5-oxoprolinase subunit PxpA n=1 Tax=Agrobacterium tumefaciens TaxID=358 RepID=UPI000B400163|nr:5-oxoprolinase subunit PxpA [Agrobacterium tumefaciens]NSY04422.1 5-oxoprolinase subunit PxpA [Agrobacterium tumefaciens]OVE86853.1 lactam utilization protein LamB [Agrobacterium tumefaciens]